jgi:glycolate oxidase iron-sulfur subunit
MAYADLYGQVKEKPDYRPKPSFAISLLLNWLSTRRWTQRLFISLIKVYQKTGMQRIVRGFPASPIGGELKQMEQLLPTLHMPRSILQHRHATTSKPRKKVALFTGCLANIFDTQTHNDTVKLLTHLGYEVDVPKKQTCCGAMHAHNGEIERARALATTNIEAFSDDRIESIIYNSSGCGAFLNEYDSLLEMPKDKDDKMPTSSFTDIMDFLTHIEWPADAIFKKSDLKVSVHEPCSQRNVLKNENTIYRLLDRIPGLAVSSLPDNHLCCGAGGTTLLSHPELAEQMRDEKIQALLESDVDLLVSTNMICALHLSSGVRKAGKDIQVIHPVQLLARQLQ